MSDLFHKNITDEFIKQVFDIMRQAHWHQFQLLTKRSDRLLELDSNIDWPHNVWMGVSVENEDYRFRIDHLRKTKAHIKFISAEPLLGPLPDLKLEQINWVIVGGESGPGARKIKREWVTEIREQCISKNTHFFFKQWGGVQKKRAGRKLDGIIWNGMPLNFWMHKDLSRSCI